ncbi:MAG: CPBP family intramembrane metalloprotease [Lachnospiraceae bacterium]|nr:CPBP family intramembrane metalloprotease [Lachnospiraceae bacterium]
MKRKEEVNLVFLLTVAVYLAASFVISMLPSLPFVPLILTSQLAILCVPFVYAVRRGNVKEEIIGKGLSFGNIILLVMFTLCIEPLLTLINGVSQCFFKTPTTDMITEEATKKPFIVMFLLVALLPAICEEFVYRGVFFRGYEKIGVVPGAILSGFLFGVLHGNLNQFTYAFVMGAIFALAVYATGSLWAGTVMHLTVNGLSTVLLYLLTEETSEALTLPVVFQTFAVPALFGSILAWFLFRAIADNCGTWENLRAQFHKKGKLKTFLGMFTVPLTAGVLLMVLLMILAEIAMHDPSAGGL